MALLRELLPDAQEKVYPTGWKTIVYSFSGGMKDAMCAVNPQKKYVNLNFGRGVDLKDPKELLEGTGKSIRHVKIRKPEDVQSPELEKLIREALKLARSS